MYANFKQFPLKQVSLSLGLVMFHDPCIISTTTCYISLPTHQVALSDEYFVQRKLYPNVDYYSGIMLRAIGIPTSMFTAAW